MKKNLFSLLLIGLAINVSAQLYTNHFNSGALDTNQFKNHFNSGGFNFIQAEGPFTLASDNGNSVLKITSAGHDEWDGVAVYFNNNHTTVSMTNADKIYVRAKLTDDSFDTIAKLGITVSDLNGKTASNDGVQAVNAMILSKKKWTLLAYSISSWTDQWGNAGQPNGTCDNTKIQRLNIAINNGFASFPDNVNKITHSLTGTVVFDYLQIGGTTPANESTLGFTELTGQKVIFSNYPNPVTNSTTIQYSVVDNGFVSIKIFDVLGKEVTSLVNENKTTGTYEVKYNASSLQNGVYFYTMISNNKSVATQKMIVNK